jgi:hypothetical protein
MKEWKKSFLRIVLLEQRLLHYIVLTLWEGSLISVQIYFGYRTDSLADKEMKEKNLKKKQIN